ncbi:DUF4249 domain-containing protein [Pontibacter sp. BT310]|uniref:DUF4249 domain-containing protein n=1 Tax=Pontibacter populi TaxID=890055 RepID=A0ABS6XCJ3_9BACT|nr:DUF4249 domain-containing protein [Pontibacter sp. BT310]MBW3365727.1 DUF4249 domain-containing protein [Pontibacter populi]
MNWNKTIGWLMMLLVSSCVEPYSPEVLEGPNSYLVVNGFINTNGPTTVQLLRTQNLKEETLPPAETNAIVQVESENGEHYRLYEAGNGNYTIDNLNINPASKYRLFIRTRDGKEYASEYVEVKHTPAIDEVTWEPVDNEVQLYVSTHDPNNKTRYYRWEFEHTWHYRAAWGTTLKYVNGRIELRDRNDPDIYNCWASEYSTTIELGNSIRLSQDVISKYKLLAIPYNSEKIGVKYSILVKQYALTREAYAYWETLKKNTENIGTLFDPLPSQLTGNIKSLTDPNEPVIGYVTASTMQQKRIFIDSKDLPRDWRTFIPRCTIDTMLLANSTPREYFEGGYVMPVYEVYPPNGGMSPIGYSYATVGCVDCRTRGTNVKPAFWE